MLTDLSTTGLAGMQDTTPCKLSTTCNTTSFCKSETKPPEEDTAAEGKGKEDPAEAAATA